MISWDDFNYNNPYKTKTFEQLCRLLFKENYCYATTNLRSNPNHKGLEVDPIKGRDGHYIGFQSKFFESSVNYQQIQNSFKSIVEEYKCRLDVVYLYTNKDIDKNSKGYKNSKEILKKAGIECVIISNDEILIQASQSSCALSLFFKSNKFDLNWFKKVTKNSLRSLSARYNKKFNAVTKTEKQVSLFCGMSSYNEDLSKRLEKFLRNNVNNYLYSENSKKLLEYIARDVCKYKAEIDIDSYIEMNDQIKEKYFDEIEGLKKDKKSINNKIHKFNENMEVNELIYERKNIESTLSEINKLLFTNKEEDLVRSNLLILKGDAGVGKSHTFAISSNKLLNENRAVLFLPGYNFIGEESIEKQILEELNLYNFNFPEFLNALEGFGKLQERPVILFFDGINETDNTKFWRKEIEDLYNELESYRYIKVAFSYRNGFEHLLNSPMIKDLIKNKKISVIEHEGLDFFNYSQIGVFLENYDISLSPLFYFNTQLRNPLFLKLFCENYDGRDFDIQTLFEKIIDKTDEQSREEINFTEDIDLLRKFIKQFISLIIEGNLFSVNQKQLFRMPFWSDNGVIDKHKYVGSLERNGLLNKFNYRGETNYIFAYNLLQDYLIGSELFKLSDNYIEFKNNIYKYLYYGDDFNYQIVPSLIFASEMGYEDYDEELLLDILKDIYGKDKYFTNRLAKEFVRSYSIRKNKNINLVALGYIIDNYEIEISVIYDMLIENSTKINNELNADYLHKHLFNLEITKRDYYWTQYINGKSTEDSLYSLIESLESRDINTIDLNTEHKELLLTLLGWTLTSSNRVLRDKSSKAITEIFVDNYNLCLYLLKKFKGVNDTYILQRLYGAVFGASVRQGKSNINALKEVVNYIYKTIFKSKEVYPDVFIRDYSRLTIEYYLSLEDDKNYNIDIILPPYNSKDIPRMQKSGYDLSKKAGSSKNAIISSMSTEEIGPLGYGDFGRYIFQSTLNEFEDIDIENCYYYMMNYIFNNIGFDENLFIEDSSSYYHFNRHDTLKVERIGKKYQWIAFHNLLAKLYDNYEIDVDGNSIKSGTWDSYIRDFDPTFNNCLESNDDIRNIKLISSLNREEFISISDLNDQTIENWINSKSKSFKNIEDLIKIKDSYGDNWIVIDNIKEIEKNENVLDKFDGRRQEIFNIIQAYFIKIDDKEECFNDLNKRKFYGRTYPEGISIYSFFSGECYWSDSCKNRINNKEWSDINIETDEYIEKEVPNSFYRILNFDENSLWNEKNEDIVFREYIKKKIYSVLHASNTYSFKSEYDGSVNNKSSSIKMPNSEILTTLGLQQKNISGVFYLKDEIVAFDSSIVGKDFGLVIKEKYLLDFMKRKNYLIFWSLIGEKRFIGTNNYFAHSKWDGYAYYDEKNCKIINNMNLINKGKLSKLQ